MNKLILPIIALLSIAALSASAYPPPEENEVRLNEVESQLLSFDGKIIEVMFSYATSLEQEEINQWSILCGVWTRSGSIHRSTTLRVNFSGEEAKEYFDDLIKKPENPYNDSANESIYLLVEGKKYRAIGTRFKKSKGTYSW